MGEAAHRSLLMSSPPSCCLMTSVLWWAGFDEQWALLLSRTVSSVCFDAQLCSAKFDAQRTISACGASQSRGHERGRRSCTVVWAFQPHKGIDDQFPVW